MVKATMSKSARGGQPRVGNCLWKYRKRMGFSQRQAAAVLPYVSQPFLSRLERGVRLPSLITALKLEIVYRVPVAFLFPEHYRRLKATIRQKEEVVRTAGSKYETPA